MNASIQFLKSIPAFNKLMRNLKVNNVTFYLIQTTGQVNHSSAIASTLSSAIK